MTNYVTLLKDNKLKATFQRIYILDKIERHGHISIDNIYDEISKLYPTLSLATVYKNIILMINKGVITEVPISGQKIKYELTKEEHIHLICTNCGAIRDKAKESNNIFNFITKDENFILEKQQINLYGICLKCQ